MELETPFVHLRIKDKILIGTYKKGVHINYEIAQEIVRSRLSFTGGKIMAGMIMSQGVISIDKPAREFFSSNEGTQGLTASAIIVNSAFSRFMGNFFLRVNKTQMPVKLFSNIHQAEKWLQQFIV